MSNFTEKEIEYLNSQRLGRMATINKKGEPHVVPVGFRYNPEADSIEIGGHNFGNSVKYKQAVNNKKIAFVVDDVLPPWEPRGIEIRGEAEPITSSGDKITPGFDDAMIRIRSERIVGWGLDTDAFHPHARSVE